VIHHATSDEIIRAIKKMKNGKVASPDEIPAEAIKMDVKTKPTCYCRSLRRSWNRKKYQQTGKTDTSSSCKRKIPQQL
jgi:hypothetical protein